MRTGAMRKELPDGNTPAAGKSRERDLNIVLKNGKADNQDKERGQVLSGIRQIRNDVF